MIRANMLSDLPRPISCDAISCRARIFVDGNPTHISEDSPVDRSRPSESANSSNRVSVANEREGSVTEIRQR
jgi:hypothetical protein